MKIIYVVYGKSGVYDDFRSWDVKAFMNENRAKEFVGMAQKEADEICVYYKELEARPDLQWPQVDDWYKFNSNKELREEHSKKVARIRQLFAKLERVSKYDPEAQFGNGADPIEYDYYSLELDEEDET